MNGQIKGNNHKAINLQIKRRNEKTTFTIQEATNKLQITTNLENSKLIT